MTFFKRQEIGRVYVLRIDLPDGCTIHKIGMTNSDRSTDRMFEILRSWFNHYRYTPYCEIRLDMGCSQPAKLEKFLHKVFESVACPPDDKVDGHTEMFYGINEFRLLKYIRDFDMDTLDSVTELTKSNYKTLCELLCKN